MNPIKKTPKLFKLISAKACRMFRKYLEPNSSRRAQNFADLVKFMDDKWLCKRAEKDIVGMNVIDIDGEPSVDQFLFKSISFRAR